MSNNEDSKKQELIDKIACTSRRGAGKRAGEIERFTRQFFANVSPTDCAETGQDCLRGAVSSLWQYAQSHKPSTTKIRVFNPDHKKDGWSCGHTVVEIINDDMPFLVDSVTAELNQRNLTVHLIIHPVIAASAV